MTTLIAEQRKKRAMAMKEYFTSGELIVINEALFTYQYACTDRAENCGNRSGINTSFILKLKNIAETASDLREDFEPFPL